MEGLGVFILIFLRDIFEAIDPLLLQKGEH
jgi:hypothetical protein